MFIMSLDKKLKEIKAEIRSLVVSSPVGLNLNKFLREYRERIGNSLPYNDFGFSNVKSFLNSLNDVIKIVNTPSGTLLVPVGNDQIAHINELVQHQRKQKPTRYFQNQPARPEMMVPITNKFVQKVDSDMITSEPIEEEMYSPLLQIEKDVEQINNRLFSTTTPTSINNTQRLSNNPVNKEPDVIVEQENVTDNAITPFSESCKSGSSDNSDCNELVSDQMKENFRLILEKYPGGMSSNKLCSLYKETFGCPLTVEDLGFTSLREMVLSLPNIFTFEKTKYSKEWTLYDARINPKRTQKNSSNVKWIPITVLDNIGRLSLKYPSGISSNSILKVYEKEYGVCINVNKLGYDSVASLLVNCNTISVKTLEDECVIFPKIKPKKDDIDSDAGTIQNALPPVEELEHLWKPYFNKDVCNPTSTFKKFVLPKGDHLKVQITDVHTPDAIWLHPFENGTSLSALMFELNSFYDDVESKFIMPNNVIKAGLLCCAKFPYDKRWYRAKILEASSMESLKVCYVDYGTVCTVKHSDVRFLDNKFLEKPIFVVRAKLHDLSPPNGQETWSKDTNHALFNYIYEKTLFADVMEYDETEPSISVILTDTTSQDDICIHDLLMEKNLAKIDALSEVKTTNVEILEEDRSVDKKVKWQDCVSKQFLKVLHKLIPPWLVENPTDSDEKISDLFGQMEDYVNVPTVAEGKTCCNSHLATSSFLTHPEAVSEIWQKVIIKNAKYLYKDFFEELGLHTNTPAENFLPRLPFCMKYAPEMREHNGLEDLWLNRPLAKETNKGITHKSKEVFHEGPRLKSQRLSDTNESSFLRNSEQNLNEHFKASIGLLDHKKVGNENLASSKTSNMDSQIGKTCSSEEDILNNNESRGNEHVFIAKISPERTLIVVELNSTLYFLKEQIIRSYVRGVPSILRTHRNDRFSEEWNSSIVRDAEHSKTNRNLEINKIISGREFELIATNDAIKFIGSLNPHQIFFPEWEGEI